MSGGDYGGLCGGERCRSVGLCKTDDANCQTYCAYDDQCYAHDAFHSFLVFIIYRDFGRKGNEKCDM
jgi:hypothetical protein